MSRATLWAQKDWTAMLTRRMNRDKTVGLSELPWSSSTTMVNTTSNFKSGDQTVKIWFNQNNIKWFEDILTTHHQYTTSHLCLRLVLKNCTDVYLFNGLKIIHVTFPPWPNPITPSAPISHNPQRSHFRLAILSCSLLGVPSWIWRPLNCLGWELVAGGWWEL